MSAQEQPEISQFTAIVRVLPGKHIKDPQGENIQHALQSLGFKARRVRMGKWYEIDFTAVDQIEAEELVDAMVRKRLVNPVIEDATSETHPIVNP